MRLWVCATAAALMCATGALGAESVELHRLSAACPPAAELAALDAAFELTFEGDPTAGRLACSAASGSRDLTRLQERAYQTLRVVRDIRFDTPLPWTSDSLYEWLRGAIDGIRFRNDIEYSFCCEPARVINVQTRNLGIINPDVRPEDAPLWLVHTALLFAHEARHAEGYHHTCGGADHLGDGGAWEVQRALLDLYALHTGKQLDMPGSAPDAWRAELLTDVQYLWNGNRFCDAPSGDLGLGITPNGALQVGQTASWTVTVTNASSTEARGTRVYVGPPPGTKLVAASPSQGTCTPFGEAHLCELGTLSGSGAATVQLRLDVGDQPGLLRSRRSAFVRVFSDRHDVNQQNDQAWLQGYVRPASKPLPACKRGQKPTTAKPCRR